MTNNTIFRSVFYLVLLGGIALTAFGLSQQWSVTTTFAFTWESLPDYGIAFVIFGVVIESLARVCRLNRLISGAIIACLIAILTNTIWSLLVTVWFAFASYLLGCNILTLLKINKDNLSSIAVTLVGVGTYGTFVGLLAHFPVNYAGLYGIALAIPILLGWRFIVDIIHSLSKYLTQLPELKWFDLVIAIVALIYFSVALMPEVGHDALAMHLFIPGHLASRHEWSFDVTTYVWAVMPMMGDWLFSIVYMLAGETAARMMNVGFIFALCWLIRDLVMWAGGNAIAARWAIILFLTTPLTFTESSSLYIESVWTTFVIAGSLSIFKLLQSNNDQSDHLLIAGFLLGGALAAKAVTFTILPVLLILLIWRYHAWVRQTKSLLLGLALFFVVGVIPYATAWHLTGNPVFPFFNKIFQSPFYPPVNFDISVLYGKGLAWDVLYQVTFHTEKFLESKFGGSGFQWLLLFLPALLVLLFSRQYRGILLFVVAVLSIALTFQSQTYLRYVFPSFVWVIAGMGLALSVADKNTVFWKKILSIVGCTVILLNLVFFKSGTTYGNLSLQPLMSSSDRETYLNDRLPIRKVVELVNQLNVSHTPVAVFSTALMAELSADALYPDWYNVSFQKEIISVQTKHDFANILLNRGIDFIILDANWKGINCCPDNGKRQTLIEDTTEKLVELGTITVRKIKPDYLFQTELLINPNFSLQQGWTLSSPTNNQNSGSIAASAILPAYQMVSVLAGHRYQNSVTAVCPNRPNQGRLQVSWLDDKSNFITTNSQVFECTAAQNTHVMGVKAPPNATNAIVYITGHTNIPVIFNKVSFKQ